MGVRETSRESYKKIKDLGAQQQRVFEAFKKFEPATDGQVADYLDLERSRITGRRHELVQYGFIVEHGKTFDKATKRNVLTWVTSDPFANHEIKKAVGKPEQKQEEKSVKKFSLKLKDGRQFTISEAMKDEIESSMAVQRGSGGAITLAGHEFRLSNIIIPIREQIVDEHLAPIKNEKTRSVLLVEKDGEWIETDELEIRLRKNQTPFRTRIVGVETGRVTYDMLTYFEDGYESMRDMRGRD